MTDVVGYTSCARCAEPWVLRVVAARTHGMCQKCWMATRGRREVRVGARTVEVSTGRRHRKKKLTDRRREMIRLRDKARLSALRRLAEQHPVEFAELLAEERGERGLDPWTIDAALKAQLQEMES